MIQETIRRLELSAQVHFLGHVTATQLKALYMLADSTVFPTLFEGGGLPLLEAYTKAARLPVPIFLCSPTRREMRRYSSTRLLPKALPVRSVTFTLTTHFVPRCAPGDLRWLEGSRGIAPRAPTGPFIAVLLRGPSPMTTAPRYGKRSVDASTIS